MKKLLALMPILLLSANAAYAQETYELPDATATPDNPILYFFDRLLEPLELFVAGLPPPFGDGDEGRARKLLEIAGERLAEAKLMAERNRTEHIESLMEEYNESMSECLHLCNQLNSTELYSLVSNATSTHQTVLQEVKEKVPEEAKDWIEKAIDVSQEGHEQATEHIQKYGGKNKF